MIELPEQFKGRDISELPLKKRGELLELLEGLKDKREHNKFDSYYPETGPLRRELYERHMEFFEATATHKQVLLMAGNRTGKTLAGGYMAAAHLTGRYPDWWVGKVFDEPVRFWAAGNTSETTRDIVQLTMMGDQSNIGSGMIPRDAIISKSPKAGGVPGAIDTVEVKWGGGGDINSGPSLLGFKCYAQGRKSFEGTAQHGVWFDEEADFVVYNEALIRIATTNGIVYTTFTPLEGLSAMVMSFMPSEYNFKVVH